MDAEQVMELIKSRRSVRKFSDKPVEREDIDKILEAGRWAPSGTNNQPWRFVVVEDQALKDKIAQFSKYGPIIKGAPVAIPVFIHTPSMYNDTKDHQAMGACLQTMLLMAHGLGLGAVWLGEILKRGDEVRKALEVGEEYELMAVVALGWPGEGSPKSSREPMEQMILARR